MMDFGGYPIAATAAAESWDQLHWFLIGVCVFFSLVVFVPMVVFAIKYRARPGHKPTYISHNNALEIFWTAVPTVILMVIFAWGWIVYKELVINAPPNAMEVKVMARSWGWTFQYEDGRTTNDLLFVPVNKPVRLVMTAAEGDVIHSFFVPNFRLKKDVVPGIYNTTWFEARIPGRHQFFCTEYCGAGHSIMIGAVVVLEEEDWQLWRWGKAIDMPDWVGIGGKRERMLTASQGREAAFQVQTAHLDQKSLIDRGQELHRRQGCVACHSSDGTMGIGPSFLGIFGEEVELSDGRILVRDENYIRGQIENPRAQIVRGFEHAVMPPYPGRLSELDLNALIAYIKSLQGSTTAQRMTEE
ncbi:MAG: cytochrome c oxidase subunit II [Bradymonadales bacterium]|nr:MAG: cytochrome c oxidase subunit II [Bradymonadales bacterium]